MAGKKTHEQQVRIIEEREKTKNAGTAARGGEPVVEEHLFKGHPQQVLAAAISAALLLGTRMAGNNQA